MDVTVTVRHCEIPERFRRHLTEKVTKVEQLAPRARRVAAVLRHEPNPRLTAVAYSLELTVHGDGPVVRAEASADEPYAALDLAMAKIVERLRRAHDRKVVKHPRMSMPAAVPASSPVAAAAPVAQADSDDATGGVLGSAPLTGAALQEAGVPADSEHPLDGESPITIREKVHEAEPMTLDQALYEMELVGHDFYLYVDADAGLPSVVYRRKGWSYGVIRLSTSDEDAPADPALAGAR